MSGRWRTPGLFLAAGLVLSLDAAAQTVGGAVPPYQAPPPAAPPSRSGAVAAPAPRDNPFQARERLVEDFAAAYRKAGKPKLALYWNRELSDTLNEWYADERVVSTRSDGTATSGSANSSAVSGDMKLQQSRTSQATVEHQQRIDRPADRLQPSESWEWQFQDGFLEPLLAAGATVVDRALIVRLTGAMAKGSTSEPTVETMALQGYADLLLEILVTPQDHSRVGYELRARILDVRTGRIVSYVNSRDLKDWNRPAAAIASDRGFELPDADSDDDIFGPQSADSSYKATPDGFVRKRKPPKLSVISRNLAYNVMENLAQQWR